MLPFFFRHYDRYVERYFVFDNGSTDNSIQILEDHGSVQISHFDVHGDSFVEEEKRLCDTVWQGSDADWVIVTDIDEHIIHRDLIGYLQSCREKGVTAIESIGYEMVSDSFPQADAPLAQQVTLGNRSAGHDRLCIFDPKAITETDYEPGRHGASPKGRVIWPEFPQVLLCHFKQLGVDYPIARSAELRQGIRSGDLKNGWGFHYSWSATKIRANWKRLRVHAGPVPGLGTLEEIDPWNYFEEERVVQCSGLIDPGWYLKNYPDIESANVNPTKHYCAYGWIEDRKPSFYFEPKWYRRRYRLSRRPNPFFIFITRGEKENAWPCGYFNTPWYRAQYGLSNDESPLRHYFLHRKSGRVSPNPDFDAIEYCQRHPEVLASGEDPFESYCREQS
jgi:hypothetical protein